MRKDIGFGALGLVLSAVYLYMARSIPMSALGDPVGARGLPMMLGILLMGASLMLIAAGLLQNSGWLKPAPAAAQPDEPEFDDPRRAWIRASGVVAIAVSYIVLLPLLGYITAAVLLLIASAIYFGAPRTWGLVTIALVGGLMMWSLFGLLLQVRLPGGLPGQLF